MREGPHSYISGGTLGDCQRCGFTRRLDDLILEWSGLRVCHDNCYDPRPEQLSAPVVGPEGLPRPDASPELPVVFVDMNSGPEDL